MRLLSPFKRSMGLCYGAGTVLPMKGHVTPHVLFGAVHQGASFGTFGPVSSATLPRMPR
ncbi:hypothetical protein AM571_PC00135 (plasmid) [Rhizobium etli 8C-3]|uniref:Uncharacterized protein n=1 Tax=Rhizobium etli 8C-3 TaxID=538025 RepID=A0A1L5PCT9_RHIET|nr:hypothetical protein AM571_PC00135 [Rhizobium etli 8C-3]